MLLLNLGLILVTLGFVIVIQFVEPLFVWYVSIAARFPLSGRATDSKSFRSHFQDTGTSVFSVRIRDADRDHDLLCGRVSRR